MPAGERPRKPPPLSGRLLVVGARALLALAVPVRRELGMSGAREDAAAIALLLEAVGQQLPVERRGVDPEDLARALLLPARVVEHLEDVLALELLEAHVRRVDHEAALRRRAEADLLGQVLDLDRAALVEDDGALDRVLELAHVARPVVL